MFLVFCLHLVVIVMPNFVNLHAKYVNPKSNELFSVKDAAFMLKEIRNIHHLKMFSYL